MSDKHCPSTGALSRVVSEKMPAGLAQHLAECSRCMKTWERERRLVGYLQKMPKPQVTPEKTEQLLDELLSQVAREDFPGRRPRGLVIGMAAAAVLVFGVGAFIAGGEWFGSLPTPLSDSSLTDPRAMASYRASVHPSEEAVFKVISAQPDEIVRVFDGSITLAVDKLQQGERFRVITGDAEIEVVGTVFEVSTEADRLRSVRVHSGIVEVRPVEQPTVLLTQGERWSAVTLFAPFSADHLFPASRETTAPHPRNGHEKKRVRKQSRGTVPEIEADASAPRRVEGQREIAEASDSSEAVFTRAWEKFRQGAFIDAARDFNIVIKNDRNGILTEDARYWYSVALYRAGDRRRAKEAIRAFLERYPSTGRRFELSNRLGVLALDEGHIDKAEAYFRAALESPVPKIRRIAEEGLSNVRQRRSK